MLWASIFSNEIRAAGTQHQWTRRDLISLSGLSGLAIAGLYNFPISVHRVSGFSMLPTLWPGDVLVTVGRNDVAGADHARQKVITAHLPGIGVIVKRLIGLPGELVHITSGRVKVGNRDLLEPYLDRKNIKADYCQLQLGPRQCFVLGDNRQASTDSRHFGAIEQASIIGFVVASFATHRTRV